MLPEYLSDAVLDDLIARALAEDVGPGDVTTMATVAPDRQAEARFLAKESGVVAGLAVAQRVLAAVDPALAPEWTLPDGTFVERGTTFGRVRGSAAHLLTAERLALNLLQRMSGIATATRRLVDAVEPYRAQILDTRKTAPGLRLLDKWAVRLGGGRNHRIGLYDMVLIKDNHITAAGGVAEAIDAARRFLAQEGRALKIEVEARTLEEVQTALDTGGIDYLLLDNMVDIGPDGSIHAERLAEAVALVGGRVATEASGNVTLDTVQAIAATGVDYISVGALTHSVRALDISMKIGL